MFPGVAQQFQSKMKDFIKMSSRSGGVDGSKLIKLKNELMHLAQHLSPCDVGMLQQQAGKQALSEMRQENRKFKPPKGGMPKYNLGPCG